MTTTTLVVTATTATTTTTAQSNSSSSDSRNNDKENNTNQNIDFISIVPLNSLLILLLFLLLIPLSILLLFLKLIIIIFELTPQVSDEVSPAAGQHDDGTPAPRIRGQGRRRGAATPSGLEPRVPRQCESHRTKQLFSKFKN